MREAIFRSYKGLAEFVVVSLLLLLQPALIISPHKMITDTLFFMISRFNGIKCTKTNESQIRFLLKRLPVLSISAIGKKVIGYRLFYLN